MKLAIMQPYFFPYIGYFQLINAVDVFVVYDNIQYTKKGWINRNRYLLNGEDATFTIPLKKASDYLDVRDRVISDDFDKVKLLNQIKAAYRTAPYFDQVFSLFSYVVLNNETNLFDYIHYSIKEVCRYLQIESKIIKSSDININHGLKAQEKVIAICKNINADVYINAIGGQELYSRDVFKLQEIDLKFIKSNSIVYKQFENEFVPWLSIIDVLMFNSPKEVKSMLEEYMLI